MPKMIIANRLSDGLVVFYVSEGHWTQNIDDGFVIETETEAEEEGFLQAAKLDEENCIVIDPCLIEVASEGGRLRPTSIRESIRAFGPTV